MIQFPTNKQYIAVIDFEATCANDKSIRRNEMEIIELGCVVIDKDLMIVKEFGEFIKPVIHPKLTSFCTELTSITQDEVDKADSFRNVFDKFKEDVIKPYNPLFASWGKYDKNQLIQDCKYHKYPYPFDGEHLDIKRWVPQYLDIHKPKGIGGMLRYLEMDFEGTPHRGIDDVKNIVRILDKIRDKLPKN